MTEHIKDKLIKQAIKGDKNAQYHLARHYEIGFRFGFDFTDVEGIEPDIYWFRKAAEEGHVRARRRLAIL